MCVFEHTHTLSIFQFAQKNEKTYIERRNYFTSFARGYVCLHIGEHWIRNLQFLSHLTSVTCFCVYPPLLCASPTLTFPPLINSIQIQFVQIKFSIFSLLHRWFHCDQIKKRVKSDHGTHIASRVINALVGWWVFHNFAIAIQKKSLQPYMQIPIDKLAHILSVCAYDVIRFSHGKNSIEKKICKAIDTPEAVHIYMYAMKIYSIFLSPFDSR